jgi:Zn-dependent alcohol dehydrogenase
VQVDKAKGELTLVERQRPEPGPRQVRIKVQACGVCHSAGGSGLAWRPLRTLSAVPPR